MAEVIAAGQAEALPTMSVASRRRPPGRQQRQQIRHVDYGHGPKCAATAATSKPFTIPSPLTSSGQIALTAKLLPDSPVRTMEFRYFKDENGST